MATHYVDFQIGRDFFHDLHRMHRDALADGATKALDVLFGPISTSPETSDSDDKDDESQSYSAFYVVIGVLVVLQVISLVVIGVLVFRSTHKSEAVDSGGRSDSVNEGVSLHKGLDSSCM